MITTAGTDPGAGDRPRRPVSDVPLAMGAVGWPERPSSLTGIFVGFADQTAERFSHSGP